MAHHRRHQKPHHEAIASYGQQHISAADIRAVERVLRSPWLTQGPAVAQFETALAAVSGARYAVAMNNGTSALLAAYLAAGIGPGDEVITTPNTFVATSNMLIALGARPVFCDIRLDTHNIDETKIEALITKKTKAIVPVHFAGHPVALDVIVRIAKKHKLIVIEDACHALGASLHGKKIGSWQTAMSVFSFHPVKQITTAEGGAVLTNSRAYYETLKLIRTHGITKNTAGFNVMTGFGYNFRLSDIQAALGTSQLTRLEEFAKKRRLLMAEYQKLLADCPDIVLPTELPHAISAWHLFVIRLRDARLRPAFIDFLKEHHIGHNIHYPAVYRHPFYQKRGYNNVRLAHTEVYHRSCITLPLHQNLSKTDVTFISEAVKSFFKK